MTINSFLLTKATVNKSRKAPVVIMLLFNFFFIKAESQKMPIDPHKDICRIRGRGRENRAGQRTWVNSLVIRAVTQITQASTNYTITDVMHDFARRTFDQHASLAAEGTRSNWVHVC